MVPYPAAHPLGRHKQQIQQEQEIGEEEREIFELSDDYESSGNSNIVAGDGSREQQRQRQYERQRQKQQQQQQELQHWSHRENQHRFLRYLSRPISWGNNDARRRRNDGVSTSTSTTNAADEFPEAMQEGQLHVESNNNRNIMLRYWSISGRSLVTSTTSTSREAMNEQLSYEDDNNAAALLMDVNRIYDENQEVDGDGTAAEPAATAGQVKEEESLFIVEGEEGIDAVTETDDNDLESMEEDGDAVEYAAVVEVTNRTSSSATTNTTTSFYQPIRLRAILTDDESSGSKYLTPTQRQILMEEIINPALFAWSKALHVVPVGGGGSGSSGGAGESATTTSHQNLIVDQSQLYDNVSCGPGLDSGLPSVIVPEEHMTVGLAETDTVIYISVSFTNNTSLTNTSSTDSTHYYLHRSATGGVADEDTMRLDDGDETTVMSDDATYHPSSAPSYAPSFAPSETEPDVATRPTCPGTYLASATYCSTDQYDRPIAGTLSLCIPSTNMHNFFHDQGQIKRNIVTVMHEIGHVLGFNAQSLANIRDPDTGEPLTPRDGNGNVPYANVECTGVAPRVNADIPLPSSNIVNFSTVRGGVRVATIVTPTVQRVARNMFGCRTLAGAELESWEGHLFHDDDNAAAFSDAELLTPGECIGDHWSRRSFRADLMNTIVDDVPYSLYISSLTLAYFADTGWYKIDADRIGPPSMWGRNAGCEFVEKKCISSSGHVTAKNIPFFCDNFLEESSEEESATEDDEEYERDGEEEADGEEEKTEKEEDIVEIHGCSLDSSRKAICSLVEYDSAIPTEFNYFGKDKQLDQTHYYGGSDPTLDYCPVFEGYENGRCDDERSQKLLEVRSSLEVFGADNSRCVMGNVEKKRTALCLPIACVIQEQSLMIKVDGYWKHCSYAGQIISVWWNPNDYVVCPDPSRMCPTFYCPGDCLREGGICDYQTKQCMCVAAPVTNTTFTSYYTTYQRFEPCTLDGGHAHSESSDGTSSQVVERIGFELPDYYVENVTVLLDDPRDFDDKVSRMFSQLSSGEVVGLVASFMICAIFSFILWSTFVRCYNKRRPLINNSLSKAKLSVSAWSGLLSSACRATLNNDRGDDNDDGMDSPSSQHRRGGESRNPQKDKMVATLLVQMRTEITAAEAERRAQFGTTVLNSSETIVDLSSSSFTSTGLVLVNRSDLPALPEGGRVLAVVGAHIVEDEAAAPTDDASSTTQTSFSSSTTAHPIPYSEYASPLYQEDIREERNVWRRVSRLRRQLD